jgi:hypothetical protein
VGAINEVMESGRKEFERQQAEIANRTPMAANELLSRGGHFMISGQPQGTQWAIRLSRGKKAELCILVGSVF